MFLVELPQSSEQEIFSVTGTGFINGIVDELKLLLVQTNDYFSEISIIRSFE